MATAVRRDVPATTKHFDLFDLLRVLAALMVIFWHSYALTGHVPVMPLLGRAGVNFGVLAVGAFFVMSGFLVTSSWAKSTDARVYARNRIARIWPGLLVAVAVAAFIVGPWLTSRPTGSYLGSHLTMSYWLRTSLLAPPQYFLPGVFARNPLPGVVNGSLWTLPFEVVAYLGVLVLGLAGVIRRRAVVLEILVLLAVVHVVVVDTASIRNYTGFGFGVLELSRLGLWFFVGVVCFVWFDVIERWRPIFMAGAAVGVLAGSLVRVQLLVTLGMGLLIVTVATLSSQAVRRLRRGGDPSYGAYIYAFLIQQVIVSQGWETTSVSLFLVSAPAALAAGYASWHLVERPVLRRVKSRTVIVA